MDTIVLLDEFKETPTSLITVADFDGIALDDEMDPPSFRNARKREREMSNIQKNSENDQRDSDNEDATNVADSIPIITSLSNPLTAGGIQDIGQAVRDIREMMDESVDESDLRSVITRSTGF
ncbi:hypothetical protein HK096_003213, partial [Nowakowskiella sp. JEL0078]